MIKTSLHESRRALRCSSGKATGALRWQPWHVPEECQRWWTTHFYHIDVMVVSCEPMCCSSVSGLLPAVALQLQCSRREFPLNATAASAVLEATSAVRST